MNQRKARESRLIGKCRRNAGSPEILIKITTMFTPFCVARSRLSFSRSVDTIVMLRIRAAIAGITLPLLWQQSDGACIVAPHHELSSLLSFKEGDAVGDCGLRDAMQNMQQGWPGVTSVIMNIGSNIDPVVAVKPNMTSIAFEPIVPHLIPNKLGSQGSQPRLLIVPAAVSSHEGTSTMHIYGRSSKFVGSSSSLSSMGAMAEKVSPSADPQRNAKAAKALGLTNTSRTVPVIAMRAVLDAVPPHMSLLFLKTDMQGYDFKAVGSVGAALMRFHYVKNEVDFSLSKTYRTATGARNDFCLDHLPHMVRLGFRFLQVAIHETNILAHDLSGAEALCKLGPTDVLPAHLASLKIPDLKGTLLAGTNLDAYWISPRCDTPRPPVRRKEWPSLAVNFSICQLHSAPTHANVDWETSEVRNALFWGRRAGRHPQQAKGKVTSLPP